MEPFRRALLIVFYKNPVPGRVKTRLAAVIGNERALDIFRKLALHTRNITQSLRVDKVVSYSDAVEQRDIWSTPGYRKSRQRGSDLGERMQRAFEEGFEAGYSSIVIVGTDCYELTSEHLEEAFGALTAHDTVIGPAQDGGYYLLGLKRMHPVLFQNKAWSTHTVFDDTVRDLRNLGLSYATLPVLRDVDRAEDVPDALRA